MEPLTMRGALDLLNDMMADVETIVMSMNSTPERQGGFEKHIYDLRHHVSDARELLEARIAGQLRPAYHVPEWDKPLSRC